MISEIKRISMCLFTIILMILSFSCDSGNGGDNWPTPVISGVSTDYDGFAVSGKPVTLSGSGFSPVAADNKVLHGVGLGAVSLEVTEASADHLVFIAPETSEQKLKIRVSVKGKESETFELKFDNSLMDVDISEIFAKGTTVTVREGVEWTTFHGVWEGNMRNINIIKTTLNNHNRIGIYHQYDGERMNLDEKCEYLDALVGTNGPMRCCHFVRVNGVVKRVANDQDPWITNCAMTIDNGVPDIVRVKDNYEASDLPNQNVGTAGPLLIYEGRIQEYPHWANEDFLKTTHPRTGFGISKDQKTVYQVAVDGRFMGAPEKTAVGLPIPLLAKLMKGLGCYKALNFDGGGGTAMWIYGHGKNGIVNHPCDELNWDDPVLRATGNAIYIVSDLK